MSIVIINHHGNIEKYGSNHRHYKLGKELSKKDIKLTLVSSSLKQVNQKYNHEDTLRYEKVTNNFSFISLKTKPKYNNNLLRFLNYLDFTYKVTKLNFNNKPDHIVGSSVHPFTWIAAYRLSKKYNATFHIEIRDIWPLSLYEDLNILQRKIVFTVFNFLEKKYYPLAKSIIVTAPKTKDYLYKEYSINNKKVYYVPHSIDVKKFRNNLTNNQCKQIYQEFKDTFNITYVGSLSSSEGLQNLIQLAEELKFQNDIMIHIFGAGPEETKLRYMISSRKLSNIMMHGNINSKDIPYVLNSSDILWCGLKERKVFKYGISKNKFYEYIASKKPIIFHSNVQYSPLNDVRNAFIIKLNQSSKSTVLKIKDGKVQNFDSIDFLEKNHSDKVISQKFLTAINDFN